MALSTSRIGVTGGAGAARASNAADDGHALPSPRGALHFPLGDAPPRDGHERSTSQTEGLYPFGG